jgi:Ulp1 family protease
LNNIDLSETDKIFIPLFVGDNHFTLVCILVQEKRVVYLDSYHTRGANVIDAVKKRLKVLHEEQNIAWHPNTWTFSDCDVDSPKQNNCYDCAIFVIMAIDFLSIDLPLIYKE